MARPGVAMSIGADGGRQAAVGYAGSLLLADAPTRRVLSVFVLVPIATVVGLLIAEYDREQRVLRDQLEIRER